MSALKLGIGNIKTNLGAPAPPLILYYTPLTPVSYLVWFYNCERVTWLYITGTLALASYTPSDS